MMWIQIPGTQARQVDISSDRRVIHIGRSDNRVYYWSSNAASDGHWIICKDSAGNDLECGDRGMAAVGPNDTLFFSYRNTGACTMGHFDGTGYRAFSNIADNVLDASVAPDGTVWVCTDHGNVLSSAPAQNGLWTYQGDSIASAIAAGTGAPWILRHDNQRPNVWVGGAFSGNTAGEDHCQDIGAGQVFSDAVCIFSSGAFAQTTNANEFLSGDLYGNAFKVAMWDNGIQKDFWHCNGAGDTYRWA